MGHPIKNQFWIQFKKAHLMVHELNLINKIFMRKVMLKIVQNKGILAKISDRKS